MSVEPAPHVPVPLARQLTMLEKLVLDVDLAFLLPQQVYD